MKKKGDRVKVSVPMIIIDEFFEARFEQRLGTFDVHLADDQKGIVSQDEITKDILLTMPDDAGFRINLTELGNAAVRSWGQWKAKRCMKGARRS